MGRPKLPLEEHPGNPKIKDWQTVQLEFLRNFRDLEQACWKTDANGNSLLELDKSDLLRTLLSDAFEQAG